MAVVAVWPEEVFIYDYGNMKRETEFNVVIFIKALYERKLRPSKAT